MELYYKQDEDEFIQLQELQFRILHTALYGIAFLVLL
jgi:hypothetical protein